MRKPVRCLSAAVLIAAMLTACVPVDVDDAATPSAQQPSPVASASPTASQSPHEAPRAPAPRIAASAGDVAGWELASPEEVAEVAPAAGSAADGSVAVLVYAPAEASGSIVALRSALSLDPTETYKLSYRVRAIDPDDVPSGTVRARVGSRIVVAGALSQERGWTEVTGTIQGSGLPNGVGHLEIVLEPPTRRVAIDDIRLVSPEGDDVLVNGSFEEMSPAGLVANTSLVLSTEFATLALDGTRGDLDYTITDADGSVVLEGSHAATTAVVAVPLQGLSQGFYTAHLGDASGRSEQVALALVDTDAYDIDTDARFGVATHVDWAPTYDGAGRFAASLGVGAIRNDVRWHESETQRGVYSFRSEYVSEFAKIRANGVNLLAIVAYSNRLYGDRRAPDTSSAIAAYGRYAAAVVRELRPEAIEVFNEFNHPPFNNGRCGRTPDCYLPLMRAVAQEVRAVDADTPIIVGATANYDSDWFDRLWKIGGRAFADAMSFHPYTINSQPERIAGLIADAREVSRLGATDALPVSITETGTSTKQGGRSLAAQAELVVKIQVGALAAGAESVYWYDLINDSPDERAHEGNFGLFRHPRAGMVALEPKPAALAEAILIAKLNGREFESTLDTNGVIAHKFAAGKNAVVVAWAPSGRGGIAIPAGAPVDVTGLDGEVERIAPKEGVVAVPLGSAPVFITEAQ